MSSFKDNKFLIENKRNQLNFPKKWSLKEILNKKFKYYQRPNLDTYVAIYLKLSMKHIDEKVVKDVILIGLNIKDEFENYIYHIEVDNNGKYNAIPSHKIEFETYSREAINDLAKKLDCEIPIPPLKEKDFKTYMEILCSILLRLMFKDSFNLKKINKICLGANILKKKYKGLNKYLNINEQLLKDLRYYANECIWKENIAVIIIKAYVRNRFKKNYDVIHFMSWQIMKTTYLHKFRVISLINNVMEYTKFDLKTFLKVFIPIGCKQENKLLVPVLKKIFISPKQENLKEWIFYNWSGLINENYFIHFKIEDYPVTSNLMQGFLNRVYKNLFRPNKNPFTKHYSIYYKQGYELAEIYEFFINFK